MTPGFHAPRLVGPLLIIGLAVGLTIVPARAETSSPQTDGFQKFWSEFRSAVMSGDKAKVSRLTRFPFETRGPLDDDPVIGHDRQWFLKAYEELMDMDTGLTREPGAMRLLIKNTPTITSKDAVRRDWARVGDFEFERIDGKWWFNFAFVEEDQA